MIPKMLRHQEYLIKKKMKLKTETYKINKSFYPIKMVVVSKSHRRLCTKP